MRILFFLSNISKTRHFDGVIAALAERGHSVVLASARQRNRPLSLPKALTIVNRRLIAQGSDARIEITSCPVRRIDAWRNVAPALRQARDYLRFQDARYARAEKLQRRSASAAPRDWPRFVRRHGWVRRHWRLVSADAGDGGAPDSQRAPVRAVHQVRRARPRPDHAARRLRFVPDRLREERAQGRCARCVPALQLGQPDQPRPGAGRAGPRARLERDPEKRSDRSAWRVRRPRHRHRRAALRRVFRDAAGDEPRGVLPPERARSRRAVPPLCVLVGVRGATRGRVRQGMDPRGPPGAATRRPVVRRPRAPAPGASESVEEREPGTVSQRRDLDGDADDERGSGAVRFAASLQCRRRPEHERDDRGGHPREAGAYHHHRRRLPAARSRRCTSITCAPTTAVSCTRRGPSTSICSSWTSRCTEARRRASDRCGSSSGSCGRAGSARR